MKAQTIEMTQSAPNASYKMIKDEHLTSLVIASQTLSGSRVLKSTYQQVVFSDNVFYAVEFKGVVFENCIFDNCSFEFSHIKDCRFKNCNFHNCTWKAASSINNIYDNCDLDSFLSQGQGEVEMEFEIAC